MSAGKWRAGDIGTQDGECRVICEILAFGEGCFFSIRVTNEPNKAGAEHAHCGRDELLLKRLHGGEVAFDVGHHGTAHGLRVW